MPRRRVARPARRPEGLRLPVAGGSSARRGQTSASGSRRPSGLRARRHPAGGRRGRRPGGDAGFTKEEILRKPEADPRAEGGMFARLEALLAVPLG